MNLIVKHVILKIRTIAFEYMIFSTTIKTFVQRKSIVRTLKRKLLIEF